MGVIDFIVDMVGVVIVLELMGIDCVIVNNLVDGSGIIEIVYGIVFVLVLVVM